MRENDGFTRKNKIKNFSYNCFEFLKAAFISAPYNFCLCFQNYVISIYSLERMFIIKVT